MVTSLQTAGAFGLDSFSAILPERAPMTGEDPGTFDAFHAGMVATLAPASPYEQVIAENLIGIEWELVQHRRMRDASLGRIMRRAICGAVVASRREAHAAELADAQDDLDSPAFDEAAAIAAGEHLAARAVSRNPEKQAGACQEIAALGMDPVELMGEAYGSKERIVAVHNESIAGLERRRREVRRDFDALRRARPKAPEIDPDPVMQ